MKVFEVIANADAVESIRAVAAKVSAEDVVVGPPLEDKRRIVQIVVQDADQQAALDALETAMSGTLNWRIMILPIEATLPKAAEPETHEVRRPIAAGLTREELYDTVAKGLGLDGTFLGLVFLSTVVAAFGLYENSVTLIIGGMLIAPLLGPSLALSFGAAIGDRKLIFRSITTNVVGLAAVVLFGIFIGALRPPVTPTAELMLRTNVGLDSIALALASGAAAALSITSGLSSALVGVMVAVALLPPAVALGLMIGAGWLGCAAGAGILLGVNVACVNLAAQAVFFVQGIKPRTWYELGTARRAARLNALAWSLLLVSLLALLLWEPQRFVSCQHGVGQRTMESR